VDGRRERGAGERGPLSLVDCMEAVWWRKIPLTPVSPQRVEDRIWNLQYGKAARGDRTSRVASYCHSAAQLNQFLPHS
jgi:hypothetical protein